MKTFGTYEPPLNPPDIEDDGHISDEELEDLRARNIERAYDEYKDRELCRQV